MAARGPRGFEGRVADLKQMHRVPALIRAMPKIVVAAVNGPAAGAGFTLAAACDLRIAAASARFSTSFAKVGLSRSEEHTSELQSLMRISYAVFCLKKKKTITHDK